MLITYQVINPPQQVVDNRWDVWLTDLNSNGAFKIKVRIALIFGNLASGLVLEGPGTYKDKIITVSILAGYSVNENNENEKALADASDAIRYRRKTISELVQGDRLIDIAEPV